MEDELLDLRRLCVEMFAEILKRLANVEDRMAAQEKKAEMLPHGYSRLQIAELIASHFDVAELESMAWDMNIGDSELVGDTMGQKSRALIDYCERRNMVHELLFHCFRHRPSIRWPDMPRSTIY